eukprot:6174190-Pleurochrysis_carterae.AAC.1
MVSQASSLTFPSTTSAATTPGGRAACRRTWRAMSSNRRGDRMRARGFCVRRFCGVCGPHAGRAESLRSVARVWRVWQSERAPHDVHSDRRLPTQPRTRKDAHTLATWQMRVGIDPQTNSRARTCVLRAFHRPPPSRACMYTREGMRRSVRELLAHTYAGTASTCAKALQQPQH